MLEIPSKTSWDVIEEAFAIAAAVASAGFVAKAFLAYRKTFSLREYTEAYSWKNVAMDVSSANAAVVDVFTDVNQAVLAARYDR
eukprot:gene18109-14292_t